MASVYEVAYREAVRAVDEQAKVLEQIRARAGTLFSAAGVTAGVLGVAVDRAKTQTTTTECALLMAVIAFVILSLATVAVWWPVRNGWFLMDARLIIRDAIEGDEPSSWDDLHRDLALHHGEHAIRNGPIIRRRLNCYIAGLISFGFFVAALVVALVEAL